MVGEGEGEGLGVRDEDGSSGVNRRRSLRQNSGAASSGVRASGPNFLRIIFLRATVQ